MPTLISGHTMGDQCLGYECVQTRGKGLGGWAVVTRPQCPFLGLTLLCGWEERLPDQTLGCKWKSLLALYQLGVPSALQSLEPR